MLTRFSREFQYIAGRRIANCPESIIILLCFLLDEACKARCQSEKAAADCLDKCEVLACVGSQRWCCKCCRYGMYNPQTVGVCRGSWKAATEFVKCTDVSPHSLAAHVLKLKLVLALERKCANQAADLLWRWHALKLANQLQDSLFIFDTAMRDSTAIPTESHLHF